MSPAQDAQTLAFYALHPGRNSVGYFNNCAARTNQALNAGGVPTQDIPFPGGLSRDVGGFPGAQQFFIPQGGPIPGSAQSVARLRASLMNIATKIIVGITIVVPVLYIGSCNVLSHQLERGFAQVKEGDTEQQVIAAMGEPADRETASNRLAKYGLPECQTPCVQRLWYPNKLGLVGEAWSVELDASGHVTHTAHIVSS